MQVFTVYLDMNQVCAVNLSNNKSFFLNINQRMPLSKYHEYMIKSAPYGQLPSVLQNLQKVQQFDSDSQEFIETLRQYNEEHFQLISTNNQERFPLLRICRGNNNNYINQLHRKSYQVDHTKKQIISEEQVQLDLPEPVIELLKILSEKLSHYVSKYFRQPAGSIVFMQITEEDSLNVHLAFTSKNVQLNNYYTGEWNSSWTVNKEKITGAVGVKAHIFQSGNVQMNQSKQLEKGFEFTADMEENAQKIMEIIQKFQMQTQKGLGEVYEEMSSGFFKHLRRIEPVTKTKMVWNVNALKMNKSLHSKNLL